MIMSHEHVTEALHGVKGMWERKDNPTYTSDWEVVCEAYPDVQRAWEQVKLAQLAFGALVQEKIDER